VADLLPFTIRLGSSTYLDANLGMEMLLVFRFFFVELDFVFLTFLGFFFLALAFFLAFIFCLDLLYLVCLTLALVVEFCYSK